MYDSILDSMNSIVSLNEVERSALKTIFRVKQFRKLDHVFIAGDTCLSNYYISKGLFRVYSLVKSIEKTESFFMEDSWYTDFESYVSDSPSELYFQALEEGELIYFDKAEIERLYSKNNRLERLGRYYAEQAFLCIRNKSMLISNKSAEERYEELVNRSPELIQRIPQYYLASYLNVQPESLSRIKKRIWSRDQQY
jgi:CRP-like cAMP-binding protein